MDFDHNTTAKVFESGEGFKTLWINAYHMHSHTYG
jgi:hypothetical protein